MKRRNKVSGNGHLNRGRFSHPPDRHQKRQPPSQLRFNSISEMMTSIARMVSGVLLNSDVAYRQDRVFQRMMRHDPDVMSPLTQRQVAVALLDWDVVPDDRSDQVQVDRAAAIKRCIRLKFRRWHEFIRQLQEAVFYGPSAANLTWERVSGDIKFAPTRWLPLHPDSLAFTEKGELGLYVGLGWKGDTVVGEWGRVHVLTPEERGTVVLHTFMLQGADFQEPLKARYFFSGRGLRDTLYYTWVVKRTVEQLWVTYAERYAMGNRIGRYPIGNDEAKDQMEAALANLAGDVSVLIPDDGETRNSYGIDVFAPSEGRARVFADLILLYLAGQMKEMIVGQTATTEATSTGLGSDVGTRHAETFGRIIKYDACCLADTLTHELIKPIYEVNFGEDDGCCPRFEFNLEDVDSEKFIAGVKAFIDMGGTVPERQIRSRLGIDEPIDGEATLGQHSMDLEAGMFGAAGGANFASEVLAGGGTGGGGGIGAVVGAGGGGEGPERARRFMISDPGEFEWLNSP